MRNPLKNAAGNPLWKGLFGVNRAIDDSAIATIYKSMTMSDTAHHTQFMQLLELINKLVTKIENQDKNITALLDRILELEQRVNNLKSEMKL